MMNEGGDGLWVERRFIPFPRSVSEEARQSFRAVNCMTPGHPLNLRELAAAIPDPDRWNLAKAAVEQEVQRALGPLAAGVQCPVETVEMGGAVVHVATPAELRQERKAVLEIHAGALVVGDDWLAKFTGQASATMHGARCYSVDYRMPPKHPYPAGLDDCVAVYRKLLHEYTPQDVVVSGASAGGNLAGALVVRARDEGLPLPAGLLLGTPEIDLTESGDSFQTFRFLDTTLPEPLMTFNLLYANGHDLSHPYLSPLFADFSKGFPPTFLHCGTRDLFLSNTVRMHRALRRANIPTELHVVEGSPHGGFFGAPEDVELAADKIRFVAEIWANASRTCSGAP